MLKYLLPSLALVCSLTAHAQKGILIEAESFQSQAKAEQRKWTLVQNDDLNPSGGAYLKCLPDTRVTHDDKLIVGENFSNEAGALAVLTYQVNIDEPGRYYVWVSAYSQGTEDNGIHVGINGQWPASGQRMQWCEGKNQWTWESKQRTEKVHCGEPFLIYLDIEKAGKHTIHFSMREDGFAFDRFLLTKDKDYNPGNI